jgi:hypothetical protein
MSAFQPNKFQPVWRYIQKDMAVLILVVGSSRKSGSLSISLIFLSHSLSPQSWAARLFSHGQHVVGSIRAWSALHFIQDNRSSTKLDHVPTKTWTAAVHAWQQHSLSMLVSPAGQQLSNPRNTLPAAKTTRGQPGQQHMLAATKKEGTRMLASYPQPVSMQQKQKAAPYDEENIKEKKGEGKMGWRERGERGGRGGSGAQPLCTQPTPVHFLLAMFSFWHFSSFVSV